ncbi:MAG: hypothetical protein HFH47_02330 [Bacilli bacterium]|nr:hypothetical protein [Bacilli bacterium]
MKKDIKLNVFSGTVGTVLGTGVGYSLNSGDCFTIAAVGVCGCAIGALTSHVIHQNKKIKKLKRQIIMEDGAKTWSPRKDYCFKAGTLVLMENGYKNIEDVVSGDLVYSYNMETKTKELKKVVRTFINEGKEMLTITVDGIQMGITPNHTCYVNGQWVLSSEIKIGDKMLDCDGHDIVVENVETSHSCEKVYNFEVEDNHNYFVTDLNVLVHNDSSCDSF